MAGITGATGAVAGAYIADITDGDERARHFGFMSACFGFGMVAGPVLRWADGRFLPTPVLRRGSLERPQFPDGLFPFAGVAQRRTPAVTPGGSQPARFVPVGPGMTVVAAPMAVFFIMQLVGQVPAALWVIFGEIAFTGTRPRSAFRLPHLAFCIHSPRQ